MKQLCLWLALGLGLSVGNSYGQIGKKIEGAYSSSQRGNPEGNARLYITADNHFAIPYFGGVVVGKWHEESNGKIRFVPNQYPHSFAVWAWHNPELKDSTSFYFSQCQEGENYFGYSDDTAKTDLKLIFNTDNNCVAYPNVLMQKGVSRYLQLVGKEGLVNPPLYTFNNERLYNSFAVFYISKKSEKRPFTGQYKDGKLMFERYQNQFDVKHALKDESEENLSFLKELTKHSSNELPDTILINNRFNQYDMELVDTLNYTFDVAKNAFVNFLNYKEGESDEALEDYNNSLLLYPYKKLHWTEQKLPVAIKLLQQPIFNFTCEDH
ncbi:hypothetical protein [Taibaiella sp. KBW10]|uniref:hypothetical protein n=1 Tax=Taibaiella sp. KBW10 TaxID=2153357 RepID=UPI000F5B5AA2|nr:hypothetical protein [Taibaiella sp. KBW10]